MTDRRTGEWELLQHDSDPVPYDPQDIRDEAEDYADIVTTIEEQITSLKRLADPDERLLVGQYADKLTDAAEDLGDHLGKIKDRFDEVSGHLKSWAGTVEGARTETAAALKLAVEAKAAKAEEDAGSDDGGDKPSPLPGQVPEELRPAVSKAEAAMSHFDSEAGKIAGKIRDSSDDDMKDSKWDKFKDWVSGFADLLDAICDVLGWIAAALVIAAIIFSGVGALLALAAIFGLAALLGHGLLAVTGNGSWLDVLFDAVSLVTMGMGGRALKGAYLGRQVVLKEAGEAASKKASENIMKQGLLRGGNGYLGRAHVFLRSFNPFRAARAANAGDSAFVGWTTRALPESGLPARFLAAGDQNLSKMLKELPDLTAAARGLASPESLANLTKSLNSARNFALAGMATDFSGLAMNPKIGENLEAWQWEPHKWAEDQLTITIGGPY